MLKPVTPSRRSRVRENIDSAALLMIVGFQGCDLCNAVVNCLEANWIEHHLGLFRRIKPSSRSSTNDTLSKSETFVLGVAIPHSTFYRRLPAIPEIRRFSNECQQFGK